MNLWNHIITTQQIPEVLTKCVSQSDSQKVTLRTLEIFTFCVSKFSQAVRQSFMRTLPIFKFGNYLVVQNQAAGLILLSHGKHVSAERWPDGVMYLRYQRRQPVPEEGSLPRHLRGRCGLKGRLHLGLHGLGVGDGGLHGPQQRLLCVRQSILVDIPASRCTAWLSPGIKPNKIKHFKIFK